MRLVALLLSLTLLQTPAALPPTRDQVLGLFGSYFDALRIQSGIPGMAAAIVGDSDVIWDQGFGQQDLGNFIAARADTPFAFDGLTQLLTATLVLRCAEEGHIWLDAPIGQYVPDAPEPNATIAQILSHTAGSAENPIFSYNVPRLEVLKGLMPTCSNQPFRRAIKNVLDRLAMSSSMPGLDATLPTLPPAELATPVELSQYASVLSRLAVPYSVTGQGTAGSQYTATTLGAGTGLISTVRDFAKFDLALRQGILVRLDTLSGAWVPPTASARPLPHAKGWFVQTYNGEPVVWQFGVSPSASSSLVITLPARSISLILVANSDGLAKPATLVAGDVTVSPFARVFLGLVAK